MIGNDIVDLYLAEKESRCHRKGFLDKLFTPAEKSIIENATAPLTMIWLLWSCKEAAYKIVHRATRHRTYAPQKFECHLTNVSGNQATGTVIHDLQPYYFLSTGIGSCIHTRAAVSHTLLQQTAAYTLYHRTPDYAALLHTQGILQPGQLFWKDADGIPYIRDSYSRDVPVSVSHHGKYVGMVMSTE
ncbi:4'-phosphopantetheinyl transferase superfamily protein [Chitinophaga niastensis]|uniref:4'-phosphopantetheinyl transferase superfamily protein n=1 Tax=Chitinophaga niastensis TaxID=536980 RepID=A0A2P8HGK0_CHINA|nr:4'-phosphopantetheinyl transferase superfamily protein [Chitinophaga niastensis]PSL45323.1 4'-phosphopantetheinyl transferase superfamily protein [Chitinophaga niastensis]